MTCHRALSASPSLQEEPDARRKATAFTVAEVDTAEVRPVELSVGA